jgi:diguanylate cyclase (GGDEF)-like protein
MDQLKPIGALIRSNVYIYTVVRRWWLVVAVTVVTFLLALVLVTLQEETYESKATFFLRPHTSFTVNDDFVRDLDTLSRNYEINNTYAEVAGSKVLKNRAAESLGLPPEIRQEFSVNGRVHAGTNILEISVRGPEPDLVKKFADAVGDEIVSYVSNLYDVFELQLLDSATAATAPVRPKTELTLFGGLVFGLALGLSLAFMVDYWSAAVNRPEPLEIIDGETGIHNRAYFMLRLREEISRARHNNSSFALALVELNYHANGGVDPSTFKIEVIRRFASFLISRLRDEDIVSRYDETKLALMLMDYGNELTRNLMEDLMAGMGSLARLDGVENGSSALQISAGVVGFHGDSEAEETALLTLRKCP